MRGGGAGFMCKGLSRVKHDNLVLSLSVINRIKFM